MTTSIRYRFAVILFCALCQTSLSTAQEEKIGSPEYEASKNKVISVLELKQSPVSDASRLIAEISNINVVATADAGEKEVSVYLRNIKTIDAIETICKVSGLWYREEAEVGLIRIMTTEEYSKDLVIYREDDTQVFTLLHPNVFSIAQHIQDLYGERVVLSLPRFYDDQFLAQAGMQSQTLAMTMQMMGGMGGGGMGGGMGRFGGGMGGRFGGMMGGFGGMNSSPFAGGMGGMGMMGMGGMGMMGMGGMGMGMGGMGGGQAQRGFSADAVSRRNEILPDDQQLTSDQIRALQTASASSETGGADAETIQEVTSQEPPIHVAINQQHGMIIVRTSDKQAMESIEQLIDELDRPTPQVLLEVKILEVTLGDEFQSAFDFEMTTGDRTQITNDDGVPITDTVLNTATQGMLGSSTTMLQQAHALGTGNFELDAEGSTFVYQFLNNNFRARVQLLEEENRVNIVATPMLLASNNRPASLRIGEQRRLTDGATTISNTSVGGQAQGTTVATSQQQVGTTLMLLPKINADRTVTMTIFQERTGDDTGKQDSIPISAEQTVSRPVISNATTVNTIVAKDGLTVAIGGLVEERVVRRQLKVPLLGDLPTIGQLFRKEFNVDQKTELVILITPHVITTPQQARRTTEQRMAVLSKSNYIRNGMKDTSEYPGVKNLPPDYGQGIPFSLFPERSNNAAPTGN